MKKILFIALLFCIKHVNAQVCFSGPTNFSVGSSTPSAESVVSGDFNGDGKLDLATANYSAGTISVLLGNGAGSFGAASTFTVGTNPYSITKGDFDKNGIVDLAVANYTSNNVSVLLGIGTGNFSAVVNYATGAGANSVVSADFNGDGNPDLAVANYTANNITRLLGTGSGTFNTPVNFAVGTSPQGMCVGDFNGDGKKDLAAANYGSNNTSVLIGNGSGNFSAAVSYATNTQSESVCNGDFDGDGDADLAVANFGANTISVLLNNGSGIFGASTNYTTGATTTPDGIYTIDYNNDGKLDIVTANASGNSVCAFTGNGNGTFATAITFTLTGASAPRSVIAADFNGDTKPDLAIANSNSNNVSILLNNSPFTSISGITTICIGNSTTLIANGANTYSWSPTVTVVNTSATSQTVTATPTVTTTYTVSGTNTSCTVAVTNTISVNVNALPNVTGTPSNTTICSGTNVILSAGGALTYTWSTNAGSATTSTVSVSPTIGNSYGVSGTDGNGCINSAVTIVNVNSSPTVTISATPVGMGGSVCAGNAITLTGGGITGGTYTWTGGVNNGSAFVPPSSNTYTVTGTDGNGCSNTASISITVNPLPTVTANATATLVCAGTLVTLTGGGIPAGTGTYSWNDGHNSGLSDPLQTYPNTTQTYTVTGTDLHSCTNTSTITINVNPLPTIQINGMINNPTATICMGNTATLTASGASTYLWQSIYPGGTLATVTVSPTSTTYYNVQGTDVNGCVNTNGINVYVSPLPNATVNSTTICAGAAAILTATVTGGTSPYLLNWNTGASTYTLSPSPTATTNYTITVTDMSGCSGTAVSTVSVNALPTILINGTNGGAGNVCLGSSAVLTASGGSGANPYTWSTTATTSTISVSPTVFTTYNVTGIDVNSCTNTASFHITVNSLPTVSASSATVCAGHPAILTASGTATGYSWSTTATTATISASPTITTTYTVTGTDANTCTNTATGTVTAPANPMPYICMITADSLALNNIIYWDKTLYTNADSFIVYRYDAFSTTYFKLGAVKKDSSQFTDIQRNIGGPNGGDPQYGNWQYKLAVRDTCGNISAKSPFHQSIFVQENFQNFSWNAYTIESGQSNPTTGYSFQRDNLNTGSWHVLINTTGLSSTDPNYSTYTNGNWRVEALGFNCTPTMRLGNNSAQGAIVRSKSNITNNRTTKVNQLAGGGALISVYPNPSNGFFAIQSEKELGLVSIYNSLGEIIFNEKINSLQHQIDLSKQAPGIYFMQTQGKHIRLIKE